jgi:uncharacterized membrane protein (DUF2068 family)
MRSERQRVAEAGAGPRPPPTARASGVRAILIYKAIKASAQISLALLLVVAWPLGLTERLQEVTTWLRDHATHGWAIRAAAGLAEWLTAGDGKRRLEFTIVALGLDGMLTGIEAWALYRARWWGPWLVVAATGSLLPFEIYELFRRPQISRVVIFVINLAILVYLARRAWGERRERRR